MATRDDRIDHVAIKTYHDMARLWPAFCIRDDIIETVGDTVEDVLRWRATVKQWISRGYNPMNLDGMLRVYREGGLKPQYQEQTEESALNEWKQRGGSW